MTMRMPLPLRTNKGVKFPTEWTRAGRELESYPLEQALRRKRDSLKKLARKGEEYWQEFWAKKARLPSGQIPILAEPKRSISDLATDAFDFANDKVRDLWRKFDQPWTIPTTEGKRVNPAIATGKKYAYEDLLAAIRNTSSLINDIDSAINYLGSYISPEPNEQD